MPDDSTTETFHVTSDTSPTLNSCGSVGVWQPSDYDKRRDAVGLAIQFNAATPSNLVELIDAATSIYEFLTDAKAEAPDPQ